MHDATPESLSDPLNSTVSGFEYHPFTSGGRAGCATVVGGVESKRKPAEAGARLPALSVHSPATPADPESGPAYVAAAVHDAIPEVASLPANEIATGFAYHPFASGARPSDALAEGGVASYSSVSCAGALVLPAASRQLPVTTAEPESGPE